MRASPFGEVLAERTDTQRQRGDRLRVGTSLALPSHPEILVIGDLAAVTDRRGKDVHGPAAVATIQQVEYVAKLLKRRAAVKTTEAFKFRDQGSMAVIGRKRAVGSLPGLTVAGLRTWILWVVVHIYALIGSERRLRVMLQ